MFFQVTVTVKQQCRRGLIVEAADEDAVRRYPWGSYAPGVNLAYLSGYCVRLEYVDALIDPPEIAPDLVIQEEMTDEEFPKELELAEGAATTPDLVTQEEMTDEDEKALRELDATEEDVREEDNPALLAEEELAVLNFFDYRRHCYVSHAIADGMGVSVKEVIALAMRDTVEEIDWWPEERIRRSIDTYLENLVAENQRKRNNE
jgi:hypothetical protein